MKQYLARLVIVVVAVGLALLPGPIGACSEVGARPLGELLAPGHPDALPAVGFYEQRHIAWTPGFFLRSERSASVVTRYWGTPPNLSVAGHGYGGLLEADCSNAARSLGVISFHANSSSGDHPRTGSFNVQLAAGSDGAPPSAAEEALVEERYGPAVEVSLGPDDYIAGYVMILWRPILWLAVLVGFGLVVRSRLRRLLSQRTR